MTSSPFETTAHNVSRRTILQGLAAAAGLVAVGDSLLVTGAAYAADAEAKIPTIPPLPERVAGVRHPQIPVTKGWLYSATPPSRFWEPGTDRSSWRSVDVPGEPAMQGETVKQEVEAAYQVDLNIPADYSGRRAMLRFDGVYSYARVWVNGTLVAEHDGGFTSWYADLTRHVKPGRRASVTVGVTDKSTSIAGQTTYAKHVIGGILRDVTLVALPQTYLTRLHVDTTFDKTYTDATLVVTAAAALPEHNRGKVRLELEDPQGKRVALDQDTIPLTETETSATVRIPVRKPEKWDAEHPRLYRLTATFSGPGGLQTVTRSVGFRQVTVQDNRLLVNGAPVHLLGVCHHSISASGGRSAVGALDVEALRQYKAANCNFVRTSHYPPTPALLDAADKIGLYIEVESPVCFQYDTVDDPDYRDQYLGQFAEMIERDRSHPSVIEWSLGNESGYGRNFADENEYAKMVDRSRPTVFEPAANANGGDQADIYSGHYPSVDTATGNPDQPIQYGEFAHVACYNTGTLKADPGVRDFWGHSIAKFADHFRSTSGVNGGAIWAAIDEVYHLASGPVGYGEWGVIDLWRRHKPETWLTQKAYSPIAIADGVLAGLRTGTAVPVSVHNWYDHTNLSELTVEWQVAGYSGRIHDVDVKPRSVGTITVPAKGWNDGDVLDLTFKRDDRLVDEYRLWLNRRVTPNVPKPGGTPPRIGETATTITVSGIDRDFTATFDKRAGRLTRATVEGTTVLIGGPDIVISRQQLGDWKPKSTTVETANGAAVVTLKGSAGAVTTSYTITIDGRGLMTTTYTMEDPPSFEVSDVGVRYLAVDAVDTLNWVRDSQWTAYPDDHIGRALGTASKERLHGTSHYGVKPEWPWSLDTHDYFLFGKEDEGRWTNDFRSTKMHVRTATASVGKDGPAVRVESDGADSVRLAPPDPFVIDDASDEIAYSGSWEHASGEDWSQGDIAMTESFSNTAGDTASYTFTGTGIRVIGVKAGNCGIAEISLDGGKAERIDLQGTGKQYQVVVFERTGLAKSKHTVVVRVTGEKNEYASAAYVIVDAFQPITDDSPDHGVQVITSARANYPDLGWGNYIDPAIRLPAGFSASAALRLVTSD